MAKGKQEKRRLDKSRPYGTVFGGSGSARFEQFGIQFDDSGVELDGFEAIEIPKEIPATAAGAGDAEKIKALLAENDSLRQELQQVRSAREDAESLVEEVQGQLDSANVELRRLQEELDGISADKSTTEPGSDAAKTSEKGGKASSGKGGGSEVDDQLLLQTNGGA